MHFSFLISLFFLSGIAGLIYETIWSHYLKLFLGHAAYAQTLVLAIYMGGMAAGAWIAQIRLKEKSHLLTRYAVVAIMLGAAALLFHDFFLWYQNISYAVILPFLDKQISVHIYQWISSAVIILPQSMLLGATFPYMTAGFLRCFPNAGGRNIALLYFANTMGASVGVLLSGFYLMGRVGLHGTIVTAGIIDMFVGVTVLLLYRLVSVTETKEGFVAPDAGADRPPATAGLHDMNRRSLALLVISGATAASSFMYEIGWIRMLSLVLGSSTHSFELMLSTFILGLALGSFFIRNRLDRLRSVPHALVLAQVIMGISALFSILTYGRMFHLMEFFMGALRGNDHGYFFFNIAADTVCMLVMLPSTICAGMVLPLIIHLFYRSGSGEANVGKVYSINTLGGIFGIIISVWLLMPAIGVRLLVIIGGIIDIAIGIGVLYSFRETEHDILKRYLPAVCVVAVVISVPFGRIDPALAASGVFRNGTIARDIRIVSHKDGRTATVSLYRNCDNLVLCTNGKPDAAVNVRGGICGDEYTMALCGVLPMAITIDHARAAIIGMGSGMTVHYLLYDSTLAGVDIIEIEPEMAKAARRIGNKVAQAFTDPRASLHIDDAKSFLATCNRTYDIIVSEPSNPWVSGVSGLYSREFFARIKNHLNDDGILVQWFHRYESDLSIVASIFRALREHFPNCHFYFSGSDCITIAAKSPSVDLRLKRDVFSIPRLAKRLGEMGFTSCADLSALRFSSEKTMDALTALSPAPPNSDYAPYVDLNAVKYRFIDDNIKQFDTLWSSIIPVRKFIEADTCFLPLPLREKFPELTNLQPLMEAKQLYRDLTAEHLPGDTLPSDISSVALLIDYASFASQKVTLDIFFSVFIELLEKTLPYLSAMEMRDIWDVVSQKSASMHLSVEDEAWMRYFNALCNYDIPGIFSLSRELLPQNGPIENDYVNTMLITSLFLSAAYLHETAAAENIYHRFIDKDDPGMMIRLVRGWSPD